jgi:hypothetical protein
MIFLEIITAGKVLLKNLLILVRLDLKHGHVGTINLEHI